MITLKLTIEEAEALGTYAEHGISQTADDTEGQPIESAMAKLETALKEAMEK